MRIFGRRLSSVLRAPLRRAHYEAALTMARRLDHPLHGFVRYLFGGGSYPWTVAVSTPTGTVRPTLYSHDDLLTLNEIFFRKDYGASGGGVVVDVGANLGLASLFFLSRDEATFVYAVEPVESNCRRLEGNLAGFTGRYRLERTALSVRSGVATFMVEATGRYGGLAQYADLRGEPIEVNCTAIADFLASVLEQHGWIDLVKVDTEGSEHELVDAIPPSVSARIGRVVWENNDGTTRSAAGAELAAGATARGAA